MECFSLYKDPRVLDRLLEAHGWKHTDLSGGICTKSGGHNGGLDQDLVVILVERCEHILEIFRQYHCLGLGGGLRMKVRKK